MNTKNHAWNNLSAAARQRPATALPPAEAPFGFHSRVLSRIRERRSIPLELWLRMALRALPVAAAVLLMCWAALPMPQAEVDLVDVVVQEVLP